MAEEHARTMRCSLVQHVTKSEGQCPPPNEVANKSNEITAVDPGLILLVDILKRQRRRRRMSLAGLAKRAQVPVGIIQKLEAYRLNSVGLQELLAIGKALGSKLTVGLAPVRPRLPNRLFKEHSAELVGPSIARKQVAALAEPSKSTQTNQNTSDPYAKTDQKNKSNRQNQSRQNPPTRGAAQKDLHD